MHWIAADLLMFACSVATYLAIRKASLLKLPTQCTNLASFGLPFMLFLLAAAITQPSFALTVPQVGIILATGIFLSYLAQVASLKSIELAPNPGYSLVISKSYVVLTTFLAVPLFGAQLSAQALVAVLIIVAFSALIMLNPKAAHRAKGTAWLPLALCAFFAWALLSLVSKYLFQQGISPLVFLTYISCIGTACIVIEMWRKRTPWRPLATHWLILSLVGVMNAGFNFFNFYAISVAPNVGYINATNAASIGAVTLCAAWLFKDELSVRKLVGVFGVIAGLFLLFLS